MDEDKLTQEELVDELALAFNGALLKAVAYKWRRPAIQQAHTQLKEIVEWYFDNGVAQIVGDLKKTEDWEMEI